MDAALNLGSRSLGLTAPNPAVGAILVKDGAVVGRGATAPGGRPHAERIAIAEAGEAARGATLYVTLEPCSHFGASPPCVDAVIAAGVARVVSAMEDPNPLVGGEGHARLRAAGIAVSVGAGAAQAAHDHLGHILRVTAGRPCVTLKLAETADGFASASANDCAPAHHRTDRRPSRPGHALDPRSDHGRGRHGLGRRSGLDRAAARPRSQALARRPRHPSAPARTLPSRGDREETIPTLVIAGAAAPDEAARRLEDLGVMIERAPLDAEGHVDLHHALRALGVARDHPRVQRRRARWWRPGSLRLASPTRSRLSRRTSRSAGRASPRSTPRPARRCSTDRDIVRLRRWTTGRTRCGSGGGRTDREDRPLLAHERGLDPIVCARGSPPGVGLAAIF